ncbi:autotransporter domain-containing protein [Microvirga lotononidis]|uniref:autotransporter domain-containing protein n=1 Tax=Microvirga lotononidis TaxID=864069 RepID=UPI002AF6B01B|nr:autotransporter domain-containing protein [Microvirga lotononidis]WQO30612.1 autotransporter domain-containing protein [Microvirga lotononidis]
MIIQSGGRVESWDSAIAENAGSSGTVTVSGAGANWTLTNGTGWPLIGELAIGKGGSGSLTIENGGTVNSGSANLGFQSGASGTATVTGPGSYWDSGSLNIGRLGGTGTLSIADGGQVISGFSSIGLSAGAFGTVRVSGANSLWHSGMGLYVGEAGTGSLTIENGGRVSSWFVHMGFSAGSSGTVTVSGANSQWISYSDLNVGVNGFGRLTVENGGTVEAAVSSIGYQAGAVGTVTVTDANSRWTIGGDLTVGRSGDGTLAIQNGGVVSTATTWIGSDTGGSGTVSVKGTAAARGALETSQIRKGSGTATLTIDGGVLRATADQADFLSGFSSGDITIDDGGAVFDTNGFDIGVSAPLEGPGGLIKHGAGTLTFSGPNTYSGGTTVVAGEIIATTTGALGTGPATVTGAGSALTFNGSGVSAAALPITLNDSAQLNFQNGANAGSAQIEIAPDATPSFGGGVRFAGGSSAGNTTMTNALGSGYVGIYFYDTSTAGSATITNRNGAITRFYNTSSAGSARIVNEDNGATFLSGQSTAGTATIINRATGALYFTGSATAAAAGVINEAGGRVDLAGLFAAGTAIGSLSGAGDVSLAQANLTVGGLNRNDTISGVISGTGTLTKAGSGVLELTGSSTLSGPTLVREGRLAVNGSLASSPVTIADGAYLSGKGTVGGIIAQSGATIAPGNSIGTLNVSGNVNLTEGSNYQVEINAAGQSDWIVATGAAALSGGTVRVLPDQGTGYKADSPYSILSAQGGVNGVFTGPVGGEFAFVTPTLHYSHDTVTLTLVRKVQPQPPEPPTPPHPPKPPEPPPPLAFHSVADTKNQYTTADGVEALGAGNRLYDIILGASAAGARQAFDALSGEAHASALSVAYEDGRLVREAILTRLREPLDSGLPTFAQGSYAAAYVADSPQAPPPVTVTPSFDPSRSALWGEGFGSWGKIGGNGNAAGLETSTGGFILGADAQVAEAFRLGLAGGFTRTTFDIDGRLSSGSNESVFAALYGSSSWGALSLRLGAAYAWHDIDVNRTVRFPGFAGAIDTSYDGWTAQAFGEVGYRMGLGPVQLEPFVGASVLRLHTDAFQEEGGPAALTGSARDQDLATTTLGLRAEARLSDTVPLIVRGLIGWRHAYGDVEPEALLAFSGGATAFTVAGTPIDRNALVAEAGLDWQASDTISLGIAYSGQVGKRIQEHALKGNLVWRFNSY